MCCPEVVVSPLSSRESFAWLMAKDHSTSSINFVLDYHLDLKVFVLVFSFRIIYVVNFRFFTTRGTMNFVILLLGLIFVTEPAGCSKFPFRIPVLDALPTVSVYTRSRNAQSLNFLYNHCFYMLLLKLLWYPHD